MSGGKAKSLNQSFKFYSNPCYGAPLMFDSLAVLQLGYSLVLHPDDNKVTSGVVLKRKYYLLLTNPFTCE